MTRPLAVLRPEPGNAATAARVIAAGRVAIRLPLFAVAPLAWQPPGVGEHDAIVFTSANAVRHGGVALTGYRSLPAFAVGPATAVAAREAGFEVVAGDTDAAALVAMMADRGIARALLLAGRERAVDVGGPIRAALSVYAADPLPIAPDGIARLAGSVALLHSARAAVRLAELVTDRASTRLAALSPAIAEAAGGGWEGVVAIERPDDGLLIAAAARLAD